MLLFFIDCASVALLAGLEHFVAMYGETMESIHQDDNKIVEVLLHYAKSLIYVSSVTIRLDFENELYIVDSHIPLKLLSHLTEQKDYIIDRVIDVINIIDTAVANSRTPNVIAEMDPTNGIEEIDCSFEWLLHFSEVHLNESIDSDEKIWIPYHSLL